MRILFCNKYNFRFSGTEAYLFDVMELLRSAGHEVALFSMDYGQAVQHTCPQYLVPSIDFKQPGQSSWKRVHQAAHIIYSRSARRKLREAIEDFHPDIAHIRNIYHHLSPSILWELRAQHFPVLYQVNDFKMICPSYSLVCRGQPCERCRGGAFWRLWSERCYDGPRSASLVLLAEAYVHKWLRTYPQCVTRLLAPTQFVRQKMVENGWDADKIDVLYHFQRVPPQPVEPAPLDAPILYFGRLSPEKGIVDLLRAMRTNPQIRLLLAGDGPQRSELERLVSELQLTNVTFLGKLYGEDLDRIIAASRFTVFPSRGGEVLGKTILEAYAQSRPVVATDLGSRRELVIDGETGLLYRPGDHEQLAAAIAFLYAHPPLVEHMGKTGRALVLEKHTPAEHLAKLTAIYERMLSETFRVHTLPIATPRVRAVRVAFIGGRGVVSRYSGIEAYYEEVGKRLAAMGHKITIYCRTYFTPEMKSYFGMRLVRLPTIRTKHLDTLVHTLLSTLHATFGRYDIVHYHTLGPALFSWIPRLAGKRTVVTVQGLDWQRKKWGRIASAVLRLGECAAVLFPNATMVVSRTLQDYFSRKYHQSTTYIPNGTQVCKPRPVQYLNSWGLEPGNYVLFLGRFSPEKNCDVLIRAYERLGTSVKLVLAGGSSYSDAYTQQLRSHASERVCLLNWVSGEALEELLTNAMLFVLPSDLEGLSLALLDAMGAGLCVLASDVPENRELVDGAGYTFRAGDEQALAEMLRRLIDHPDLREHAGRTAQNRVRQHYLWPDIARQIEREYHRVLSRREELRQVAIPGTQPRTSDSDRCDPCQPVLIRGQVAGANHTRKTA